MNWNRIDKYWNEFAELNGVELQYAERNLFHSIECKYIVDFETEVGNSIFTGILWKSQDGHNRNRTKISTKFRGDLTLQNIELKPNGIKNLFIKNKRTDFEKGIAQKLKNLNWKNLVLNNNVLEIELNGILSTKSEFDNVTEIIKKIKTSS